MVNLIKREKDYIIIGVSYKDVDRKPLYSFIVQIEKIILDINKEN